MKDLPTFKHEIADGISALAVLLINLPKRHDTKTDPPEHSGTVLVGWDDSEWYGLGRWNPGGEIIKARFTTPTGETYATQPAWWCELLIPPPLPEAKP